MKKLNRYILFLKRFGGFCLLCLGSINIMAQETATDSTKPAPVAKKKAVKNTFEGNWIQDNQSVMVPIKGTFEMDIQHRFGIVNNGYSDFWGFFAPSNIRLGAGYAPVKNLYVS